MLLLESLFNKVAGRKRLKLRCFSVSFVKILGVSFLQNISSGCFRCEKRYRPSSLSFEILLESWGRVSNLTIVIRTDSLETRAELAVLRTYIENQAILEPILLYLASKYKQTKEQGSEDYLWTHSFTFL